MWNNRQGLNVTVGLCGIAVMVMVATLCYCEDTFTGTQILKLIDKNYNAKTQVSVSEMVIKTERGPARTVESKSWSEGNDKTFTEYLAPAREKGTKMLKLGDELWIWSPSADRVIKIAGHMLRQSVMGSDLSYEDFMENTKLADAYDVVIATEQMVNARQCYILELTGKVDDLAYHKRKIWVDKERYVPLRSDLYAKSGKLLKTFKIADVFQVGDRWYPKKMVFKDALKRGDGTEFIIKSIEFDVEIPAHVFSKASLRR
ncbi:MAG: outer membrane lipoprotein-sorting protein [Elusimicrobiota bacterium]